MCVKEYEMVGVFAIHLCMALIIMDTSVANLTCMASLALPRHTVTCIYTTWLL